MDELKRCPFCDGKAELKEEQIGEYTMYKVQCSNTDCKCFSTTYLHSTPHEAKEAWNYRSVTSMDLKPCPFCGSPANLSTHFVTGTWWNHFVECSNPQCIASRINNVYRSREDAIRAWNKRSADEEV